MKTMFGKYIVLFAALQVFLGCNNVLEPPKLNIETGSFSLTINEANTGRTILPQTVQNNFAECKLEFFVTGETTNPLVSISRPFARLSEPVLLNTGTWDLYVTAYLEDQEGELKPAAWGKLLRISIGGGEAVNGSVTLEPTIDSGEGTFSWNIGYPTNVISAKMTIYPLNEGSEGFYNTWYFIGGASLISKEYFLSLDAGYYRVVFELLDDQERSAVRREILHIYQNMESPFLYTFTDSNFLVEPLKAISSAWDEGWALNQAGITAAHFIVAGADGVDDDNFEDIADWFDTEIDSPAADLLELKVLVDVALVGIAGNNETFCNAQYANRAAAENAIGLLVKNGTSIEVEWEPNETVHIRLNGQHSVKITFSRPIPFPYSAPASITVNSITASVTFNLASPQPAGTQVTATVNFAGTSDTEKKYTVNLTSIKANLSGKVKTKTVSAGGTLTPETFNFTVPSQDVDDFILTFVENDSLEGKLLILQAYGSSSDAAGVSHSFVELYNTTNAAIDLDGIGLYYADGTTVSNNQAPNTATKDGNWKRISLDGTIPAEGSFLVLGPKQSPTVARYQISENFGDINEETFTLSNRAFKVVILRSTADLNALDIQNPFDTDGNGTKAAGYIDMVGAANEYGRDLIFGFETLPARNSASEAVRRVNLTDTDNNRGASSTFPNATGDFTSIRYATGTGGLTNEELKVRKPRNSSDGDWNPFENPPPPEPTEKLMILQANTYGNNNGGGGGFSRSLVELYNNTDAAIDLSTGKYYLHIGNCSRPSNSDPWTTEWTNVITLTGTIPAKSSFFIVDNTATSSSNTNATPRAILPAADQEAAFVLSNDGFKVALMRNQSSTLSVANPFTEASLSDDYVDMLGVTNNIDGFETTAASQSRPQGPRRKSLADTDNNSTDFATVDYRGIQTGSNGMPDSELYKYWPRNAASGTWDPITGLPKVDPQVQ